MPDSAPTIETRNVPAAALRFALSPFALSAGEGDGKRFEMLARSSEAIDHWWWGLIYHDFAGMQHADRIPVDYCHDPGEIIGFADTFRVGADGLTLSGQIVSLADNDRGSEIVAKAARGVPYQASILFAEDPLLEYIPEGFTSSVNGGMVEGPCVIARAWTLRGVAICPYGYDANTETRFAAGSAGDVPVTLTSEAGTMPRTTRKPATKSKAALSSSESPETAEPVEGQEGAQEPQEAAADQVASDSSDQETRSDTSGDAGSPPAEPSDPAALARVELSRYVGAFGAENGAKWFAEGVAFSDAQAHHIAALQQQLTTQNKTVQELQTQLGQLSLGEREPVSGGSQQPPADARATRLSQAIGDGLGKAAAAMRLPGRK
ncbi:MAG: hypothetical protein R3B90_21755 [Planctomycetaceae bacterium]